MEGTVFYHPAEGCHATKEDLMNKKKNPLDIDDFCPICFDDYNIQCRVANHPPATGYLVTLFYLLFYLILNLLLYIYIL
jgi:hypothetical protein